MIKKYNTQCKLINELAGANPTFPLPQPLPTEIGKLREHDDLTVDVWVGSANEQDAPEWLKNAKVRDGIRNQLKQDRSQEELIRLRKEANNMLRWYYHQLLLIQISLCMPKTRSKLFNRLPPISHLLIIALNSNRLRHLIE